MLTVNRMKAGVDPLFQIMRFYFPPPASVLDVTYGIGSSWSGTDLASLDMLNWVSTQSLENGSGYNVIKADAFRQKGLDLNSDWNNIPIKWKGVNVIYFDPPFMFEDESTNYTRTRLVEGKYEERHVSHGNERLQFPAEEFARVATRGCIVKIQDTRHYNRFICQHCDIINQAKPWWDLYDIVIYYYFREKHPGTLGYAVPVHNYYLIFVRTPWENDNWNPRLS